MIYHAELLKDPTANSGNLATCLASERFQAPDNDGAKEYVESRFACPEEGQAIYLWLEGSLVWAWEGRGA